MRSLPVASILLAIPLFSSPAWADADSETDVEYENVWSATLISDFKIISDHDARDEVSAFFDQYEFTPNKSSALPVELGLSRLSFDRLGPDDTPQLQLRFASPTSNLGVSGSEIDQPFFNQQADVFGRVDGLALDLDYWRLRTEELRLFPDTQGRQFDDLTKRDDRFDRDRTGFSSELRLRPPKGMSGVPEATSWLAPELSVRGGVEDRDGSQQLRFLQDGSNRWGAVKEPMHQRATKAGGGLLFAPAGLFTLTFDVDYDRFRQLSSTLLDSNLGSGFRPDGDAVGFVPDTDRITGTAMVQGQIGERAVLEAGFQVSRLEQVADSTPMQVAAGLDHSDLVFYSANAAADVNVAENVSINAFMKYDQRNNRIERDTALYNPFDDGVQFDAYLKRWDRVYAGAEAVYALYRRNVAAIGARYEWIDRELEPGLSTNRIILEPNARVADRTQTWTVYGRTDLRPYTGLGVNAEIGYRGAPDTGYIVDLDKYVYGKLRASYRIPIDQTLLLSAFVNGGAGENEDFSVTGGTGPVPNGSRMSLEYERKTVTWGVTVTSYPLEDISLFASFFQSYDEQNYDLVLSSLQRYFQNVAPIAFTEDGSPNPENKQMSFVLGTHVRFSDQLDGDLSYSFTRAELDYASGGQTSDVRLISSNRSIDSDIHGIQLGVGYWLRNGLRLQTGYRLQLFDDSSSAQIGTGSVVQPKDPSETQHTITLGVTLTSDLLASSK